MSNTLLVRFHMKPRLVDEAFLQKLDACFAEVDYQPTVSWYPNHREDKVDPSRRLAAMDELKFWEPSGFPGEWLSSAIVGYSSSGAEDKTAVAVWLSVWKTVRYVDDFALHTGTDSFYFRPDFVIEDWEPEEEKHDHQINLAKADMVRKVSPIIHEMFKAYYTEGRDDGEEPVFVMANAKRHVLPISAPVEGAFLETVQLYETLEGKWICPVCGEAHLDEPPWFLSADPKTPWAEPSYQSCPKCGVRYGVDDIIVPPSYDRKVDPCWTLRQRKWLKQSNP